MNTPSPLVPQGTIPDKGKSHIRIAVFTILAIHVVLLSALLIAGCKKTSDTTQQEQVTPPVAPPPEPPPLAVESNPPPVVPSNPPVVLPPVVEPPPPPVQTPVQSLSEHTIVKGETFAILAKKYGVSTKAIEAANPGVNPTRLKIGQKIMIPPPKSAPGNGAPAATTAAGDATEKTYTVKSGDNLMKIAKSFGVTVKQLRSYNNLRTDQIKVGQKLKIPVKAAVPPPAEATVPPPVTAPPPSVPPPGQ